MYKYAIQLENKKGRREMKSLNEAYLHIYVVFDQQTQEGCYPTVTPFLSLSSFSVWGRTLQLYRRVELGDYNELSSALADQ